MTKEQKLLNESHNVLNIFDKLPKRNVFAKNLVNKSRCYLKYMQISILYLTIIKRSCCNNFVE